MLVYTLGIVVLQLPKEKEALPTSFHFWLNFLQANGPPASPYTHREIQIQIQNLTHEKYTIQNV